MICHVISSISFYKLSGEGWASFNPKTTSINSCQDIKIVAEIEDDCPSALLNTYLYYWYCDESMDENQKFEMTRSQPPKKDKYYYFEYTLPKCIIINKDIDCWDPEGCVSGDNPKSEPFDIYFAVYTKDNSVSEFAPPGTTRENSGRAFLTVYDEEVPTIVNYTPQIAISPVVCSANIIAQVYDCCASNPPAFQTNYPKAFLRKYGEAVEEELTYSVSETSILGQLIYHM